MEYSKSFRLKENNNGNNNHREEEKKHCLKCEPQVPYVPLSRFFCSESKSMLRKMTLEKICKFD